MYHTIKAGFSNRKDAFEELNTHIKCFSQWNKFYSLRLKEVLFIDDYDAFSSSELNQLSQGKVCSSPIRTGIINWISGAEKGEECSCADLNFPSIQEICEKGAVLVPSII